MKKLCAEQLQSLSKKRLDSIITGKEVASSEDESSDEPGNLENTETEHGRAEGGEQRRKQVLCMSLQTQFTQSILQKQIHLIEDKHGN